MQLQRGISDYSRPPELEAVPEARYIVPGGRPAPAAAPEKLNDASVTPSPSDVRLIDRDVTLAAVMPTKSGVEPRLKLTGSSCEASGVACRQHRVQLSTSERPLPRSAHAQGRSPSPRRVASHCIQQQNGTQPSLFRLQMTLVQHEALSASASRRPDHYTCSRRLL